MPYFGDRAKRWSILASTAALPHGLRVAARARGLGALELARAERAQLLIIGHPKSGNTWLRTLLSRLYQVRFGLPSSLIVKTDELALRDSRIPKLLATNGCYSYERVIGRALAEDAPLGPLHTKPIVFLARHPCDIAVSWYHQFTKRQSAYKNELINAELDVPIDRNAVEMWEFVRHGPIGLPSLIDFLNGWERKLVRAERAEIVRYEDLRADTPTWLARVTQQMGESFSSEEIAAAAEWAGFDNLRRLESEGHFPRGGLDLRNASDGTTFKVRRGKVGGYREDLTPEQVAELDGLVAERLSPAFGYGPLGEVRALSIRRTEA